MYYTSSSTSNKCNRPSPLPEESGTMVIYVKQNVKFVIYNHIVKLFCILILKKTHIYYVKKRIFPHATCRHHFRAQIIYKVFTCIFGIEYRQRGRFAGFSLYVSNTGNIEESTLCYKDGPHLPPLNFTTICAESGRYVIFYNERLDGVVYHDGYQLYTMYTELCEVIIKGKSYSCHFNCCYFNEILCNYFYVINWNVYYELHSFRSSNS